MNPNFLRTMQCPCCGSSTGPICIKSTPAAETASWADIQNAWRGFFKEKIILSQRRCDGCGMLYSPLYFDDSSLGALYGSMPDNTAGLPESLLVRTQEGYFRFFAKHTSFAGNFLELGPDTGLLTKFVAERLTGGKLWLFEPNRAVWSQLAGTCGKTAHEIRPEMTDFSAVPDGTISTAAMIHVMDHLSDARGVMKQIRSKMRPGGRILIVTHDERSLLARLLKVRWPAYCLQHPHLFNRETTARFLTEVGFSVVETKKATNHFPASYLLKHLLFAVGARKISARLAGNWLPIPVKLGNIMTVAEAR